eukprot:TRINITY_DN59459_c0_g1_i1.p1 TRINITY_DN59459_c0_g1~~TRINITY_DN59459_c0_g1_i1.p1  ORF type:complete len:135 (-),score=28.51 TRINITY_DN59459_c0_g1_i1:137-541(-)
MKKVALVLVLAIGLCLRNAEAGPKKRKPAAFLEAAKEMFDSADQNKDGFLEESELEVLMVHEQHRELNGKMNSATLSADTSDDTIKSDVAAAFTSFDHDHDSKLSRREFYESTMGSAPPGFDEYYQSTQSYGEN